MLSIRAAFILPLPGFGTTTKHFPRQFLGLGVTKLSLLFWHSMVFTQRSLWEILCVECAFILLDVDRENTDKEI